jgi:hypothetical protein
MNFNIFLWISLNRIWYCTRFSRCHLKWTNYDNMQFSNWIKIILKQSKILNENKEANYGTQTPNPLDKILCARLHTLEYTVLHTYSTKYDHRSRKGRRRRLGKLLKTKLQISLDLILKNLYYVQNNIGPHTCSPNTSRMLTLSQNSHDNAPLNFLTINLLNLLFLKLKHILYSFNHSFICFFTILSYD